MRVLLLGAGFSRNYGGWLASELNGELCGRLQDRPHLVEMLMVDSNFESVFGARQMRVSEQQAAEDVKLMDAAIREAFRQMNLAFIDRPGMEFTNILERSVRRFMGQFDAIFTLNQDLLLELSYASNSPELVWQVPQRPRGVSFPGVTITPEWHQAQPGQKIDVVLPVATDGPPAAPPAGTQPVFKLHGSVNWRDANGGGVLVIGTGKQKDIAGSTLLNWYQGKFRQYLQAGMTTVMTIGYGFGDAHINAELLDAARNHGLRMYLVNPAGLDSFKAHKAHDGHGRNELLSIPLVGISTRSLAETFGSVQCPTFASFWRFAGA